MLEGWDCAVCFDNSSKTMPELKSAVDLNREHEASVWTSKHKLNNIVSSNVEEEEKEEVEENQIGVFCKRVPDVRPVLALCHWQELKM